jgi:hypothetical protein
MPREECAGEVRTNGFDYNSSDTTRFKNNPSKCRRVATPLQARRGGAMDQLNASFLKKSRDLSCNSSQPEQTRNLCNELDSRDDKSSTRRNDRHRFLFAAIRTKFPFGFVMLEGASAGKQFKCSAAIVAPDSTNLKS